MEDRNQSITAAMLHPVKWLFLWLLAKLYGVITTIRNVSYDIGIFSTWISSIPVVCVGNLTAGGSGKTPLVLALARELIVRGYTPVILSRGYGGSAKGPLQVSPDSRAEEVGDEPLLMARRGVCPVVVSRDRVAGAKFIGNSLSASVILLDDGLQHRRLGRVCNIVTFFVGNNAAVDAIVEGALLPLGRFRENRDRGLGRADLVALCERGGQCAAGGIEQMRGVIPATVPVHVIGASVSKPLRRGEVLGAGSAVWIFCGIANPEGFVESVRRDGYVVAGVTCFPDHHRLQQKECVGLESQARQHAAALVCTEKDWVKLAPPLRDSVWVVYLEAEVPEGFVEVVERKVRGGRPLASSRSARVVSSPCA